MQLEEDRLELEARAALWMEARRRAQQLQEAREEEERLATASRAHALQREEERARCWDGRVGQGKAATAGLRRELLNSWGRTQLLLKECADVLVGLSNLGGGANPPAPPPLDVSAIVNASLEAEADEHINALLEPTRAAAREELERLHVATGAWLAERQAAANARIEAHRAAVESTGARREAAHHGGHGAASVAAGGMTRSLGIVAGGTADGEVDEVMGSGGTAESSDYAKEVRLELSVEQTRRSAADSLTLEQVRDTGHETAMRRLGELLVGVEGQLRAAVAQLRSYEQGVLPAYLSSLQAVYTTRIREVDAQRQATEEASRREREALARARAEAEERARLEREAAEERREEERRRRNGDPILSLVEPLVKRCEASGRPFDDSDFSGDAALPPQHRGTSWRRAREISRRAQLLPSGGCLPDPQDIRQGELGDCWFLSAITVAATRPHLVRRCFVTQDLLPTGIVCVRFFKNGQWRPVVIDDRFPCSRLGGPKFGRSRQRDDMWVACLEKAYAKLHGSYAAMDGGFVDEALVDLTGGVGGERIRLQHESVRDLNGLWTRLLRYARAGFLLGAGSPAGSDSDVVQGIVQGHAYSVLDIQEADGHRLLKLANPWGSIEWQGDWSDHSPLWTSRLKSRLGHTAADDGVFWMCLDDFVQQYASLYVCKLPASDWHEMIVRGEWRGKSAGGCSNHMRSYGHNPTWRLTITRPTHVLVALAQDDLRGTAGRSELFAIGVAVLRGRLGMKVPGAETGSFAHVREVSFDAKLEMHGGEQTEFMLRPCTFHPGEECGFTLRVYSEHPCVLERHE